MASLEYKKKLSQQARNYRNIHNCKLCPYITKSIFCMRKHLNLHRCYQSKQFNCFTSTPETYSCSQCEFTTDVVTLFNSHIHEFHSSSTVSHTEFTITSYICRKCSFETHSELVWLQHSKDECRRSQKTGTDAKSISQKVPEELPWLQCVHCTLKFKTNDDLQMHKSAQHVNQRSNSPPLVTLAVELLAINEDSGIKSQNEVQLLKCELCSFKTENEDCLRIHTNALHACDNMAEWLKCVKCSYKTRVKLELEKHIIYKHAPSAAIHWHYCHKCSFKSEMQIDMEEHELKQHSDKIFVWYKCQNDDCDFETETRAKLRSHVSLTHINNIKWFECEHCSFKSKAENKLRSHVSLTHMDSIKRFECEHCSFKSKVENLLTKHMKLQHTMLTCDQCPYQTCLKLCLKKHQRTHLAPKWRFQCNQCEFKTKSKADLTGHMQVIHKGQLYPNRSNSYN